MVGTLDLGERPTLFKKGDEYFWDPQPGARYFLGFQHVESRLGGRETHGVYVGERRGWRTFYEDRGSDLFEFVAHPWHAAVWYGAEDEESQPAFKAKLRRKIEDPLEKLFIRAEINKLRAIKPIKNWNY